MTNIFITLIQISCASYKIREKGKVPINSVCGNQIMQKISVGVFLFFASASAWVCVCLHRTPVVVYPGKGLL
jgi:hypothetical protein